MVKLKVIGTISAFLLFIGLMMWGLFAWSGNDNQKEENLNKINGSINFEVDDVYASVYGEITGSKEAIGSQDGKVFLNTLRFGESQNPDTTTWTSILANGNSNPATKITFTENGSIVTITVKIENLATDRPMLISITDTATAVKNVSRVMKLGEEVYTGDLLLIPAKQDGSTAHIVEVDLTMDVLNAKASIDDDAFYGYLIKLYDASEFDADTYKYLSFSEVSATETTMPELSVSANWANVPTEAIEVEIPSYVFYSPDTATPKKLYKVTTIPANAFSLIDLQTGQGDVFPLSTVVLPETITSIGDVAFCMESTLTSINIPSSLTSIGQYAFAFSGLNGDLLLHDSLDSVGSMAFAMTAITNLTIEKIPTMMGESVFGGCPIENAIINSGKIPESIFFDITTLKSVTLGDSVKAIGSQAFYNCDSLTSITIPDGVETIGSYSFFGCESIESVIIGDSVQIIGQMAFYYCSKLTSLIIGDSVQTIESSAFAGCSKLISVTIPDSVKTIGSSAFDACTSLENLIMGRGITSIGLFAFPSSLYKKDENKYDNAYYLKDKDGKYAYLIQVVDKTMAFCEISDDCKVIADDAFLNYEKLISLTIPFNVISIGENAFNGCHSLVSVIIGDSIKVIGESAFRYCSALTNVYYTGTAVQWGTITIGNNNDPLKNATKTYDYKP